MLSFQKEALSPFAFLNREEWTKFNCFLDLYTIWWVWSPHQGSPKTSSLSNTWELAGTANTQKPPQTPWLRHFLGWGQEICVLTSLPNESDVGSGLRTSAAHYTALHFCALGVFSAFSGFGFPSICSGVTNISAHPVCLFWSLSLLICCI